MMFRFPSVVCTRCTGFFCLAIIKGPPNDIYCIIEGPSKHYFTEKVSYSLLTSYSEYVFDVFEVITFDFLLKPITFKRFQKVLQKASTYLNMNKKLFSFSYCKKNFSIPCSEIMYIDKSGRKAFLHTPKSTYTLNMTLSNILTHVDPNLFGKIRSSCIVNLEYVQEVVRDELLLKNGESLFVSRNYRHTIKSQHLNFIRNHF